MKKIFALLAFATLLSACHKDDEPEDNTPDRTILVYLAGENNLTNYADQDLKEMKKASKQLNNKQQLIVYVDQATSTPPFFARIQDGEYVDSVSVEESLTADPAVLEKALIYMRTKYPAKSYGLVVWGHGSGWILSSDSIAYARSRAYGGDTGNNSTGSAGKYWMNIPPMARAIAKGMAGTPLTFVMGDCCSFGSIEVAYEIRNLTDYVIGSPAEVPDDGAPFDVVIPAMFNTSADFYKAVIDQYYNFYLEEYNNNPRRYYNRVPGDLQGYSVPLSVVKTSELGTLATATAQLLSTISDKLQPEGSLDLTNKMFYAIYGNNRYSYDMYNILKANTSAADFNTWTTAYKKTLPYYRNSLRWLTAFQVLAKEQEQFEGQESDCGALSMFFPRTTYNNTQPKWNTAIRQFQWNNVIRWQQYGWE
jgi:hypothetical protein